MFVAQYIIRPVSKRVEADLIALLRHISGRTKSFNGCICADVWHSIDEVEGKKEILVLEHWQNESSYTRYIHSPLFISLLAAFEFGEQKPLVRVCEVNGENGFEWIEKRLKSNIQQQVLEL